MDAVYAIVSDLSIANREAWIRLYRRQMERKSAVQLSQIYVGHFFNRQGHQILKAAFADLAVLFLRDGNNMPTLRKPKRLRDKNL